MTTYLIYVLYNYFMILKTVVYLDLVILSTLTINYLFIKSCSIFLKIKLSIIRTLIALFISVISIFLFIVPIKYIYNLRYFIGILIGIIAFKKKENKLLGISIIYILNLSFIGTLVVFKIDNYLLLLISSLLIVLIYSIEFILKKIIKENVYEYNVLIDNQYLIGYFDTGNKALFNGMPIVFVNKKYFSNIYTKIGKATINTVNGTNNLEVYRGPSIYINEYEYLVVFCFVDIKEDLILNGYLEGIC